MTFFFQQNTYQAGEIMNSNKACTYYTFCLNLYDMQVRPTDNQSGTSDFIIDLSEQYTINK